LSFGSQLIAQVRSARRELTYEDAAEHQEILILMVRD
jgi:hypothetical protein